MDGEGGRTRVKNKAPAAVQITAEQLLREAWDNKEASGGAAAAPRHQIADAAELCEYQQARRKAFEARVVMSRGSAALWLRYARWEEAQRAFARARSVYERALDADHRVAALWLAYAEMEMRHKFVNHARNVWDRAVAVLPRVPAVWLKYALMEETLGEVALARVVYGRWMAWHPEVSAYGAFVRFEERHGGVREVRAVYEGLVGAHPSVRAFVRYAGYEERAGHVSAARAVYERAAESPAFDADAEFYVAFARFEERMGELERARAVYKFALLQKALGEDERAEVLDALGRFEKQRGGMEDVEDVVLERKRKVYRDRLGEEPRDWDTWFDLVRLEESAGDAERVRDAYRSATALTPVEVTKRGWVRYMYLWLGWATWEELHGAGKDAAAAVYKAALACVPDAHKRFSFGKLWLLSAKLEIRRRDIDGARRLLGHGLGVLPGKASLYREYIAIERTLGNVDRARTLYKAWLERNPACGAAFVEFAQMEADDLQELARAREIFEVAVRSPRLDAPEAVWAAYIALEAARGDVDRGAALYERLLDAGGHVNVWLAYADFCRDAGLAPDDLARTRAVYARADGVFKARVARAAGEAAAKAAAAAERVRVLDAWLAWERGVQSDGGDGDGVKDVEARLPKRVAKRRPVSDARGANVGWEEYEEFVFPEDESADPKLKILEAARRWKMQKQAADG